MYSDDKHARMIICKKIQLKQSCFLQICQNQILIMHLIYFHTRKRKSRRNKWVALFSFYFLQVKCFCIPIFFFLIHFQRPNSAKQRNFISCKHYENQFNHGPGLNKWLVKVFPQLFDEKVKATHGHVLTHVVFVQLPVR